jgi:hypothetical protein
MPFKSKRQLQTCFGKEIIQGGKSNWDCKKWLKETQNVNCLPTIEGHNNNSKKDCYNTSAGKKISLVYSGPRGGFYFYVGSIKVYVPKGKGNVENAIKLYGYGGKE